MEGGCGWKWCTAPHISQHGLCLQRLQGGMTCVCDSCVGSHGRRLTSLWERWWITQCLMVHPPRSGRIHNTQHGTSMPEQSTK